MDGHDCVAEIFDPIEEIRGERRKKFEDHYDVPKGASWGDVRQYVYGGQPLLGRYPQARICFSASEEQLRNRRADIRLENGDEHVLTLPSVSLRQFLVAGLPRFLDDDCDPRDADGNWDGESHWHLFDPQYRLELCHAEVCRWSIFFKKGNDLKGGLSDSEVSGHAQFLDIELVNNCTTTYGFEIRLKDQEGVTWHGSFGRNNALADVYAKLSNFQAGSIAFQSEKNLVDGPALKFGFSDGDVYNNSKEWGPGGIADPDRTIRIDLHRYRPSGAMRQIGVFPVEIESGGIDYRHWGDDVEYFEKPLVRRLMHGIDPPVSSGDARPSTAPHEYWQIRDATQIQLPGFWPDGVYHHDDPQAMRGYRWLYDMCNCRVRRLSNDRFELEFFRGPTNPDTYELRRMVYGNLDLAEIPVYQPSDPANSTFTMHRFGYGARPTTMDYDPDFKPPHGSAGPVHYAYLLGGVATDDCEPDRYVCPEPFGVERTVFSWLDEEKTQLAVDLISFERILPVWHGVVPLPDLSA